MFIAIAGFKKLINDAIRGVGLRVFHASCGYFVEGNNWTLFVETEKFSKKHKAAVIELIGDLPEKGECILANKIKKKVYCQNEIVSEEEYTDIIKDAVDSETEYKQTTVTLNNVRVMERVGGTDKVMLKDFYICINKWGELEEDEHEPIGPTVRDGKAAAYWKNECGMFRCYLTNKESLTDQAKEVMKMIEPMQLNEK